MPQVKEIVEQLQGEPILIREGELGIEQLEEIIADIFAAVDGVVKLFNNEFPTALLTFAAIASKYQKPKEIFEAALNELREMDEQEALALWQAAADQFDIEDDELEAKIEALLKLPVVTYAEVNDVLGLLKQIQVIVKDEELTFFEKVKSVIALNELIFAEGEDAIDLILLYVDTIKALGKQDEE